jgi:hypothetical protein
MVPGNTESSDNPAVNRRRKEKKAAHKKIKRQRDSQKKVSRPCVPKPEDIPVVVKCNYPEWHKFLKQYPMIHSIQREDFPDHGVSFVYVAHFYRTKNNAEESVLSQRVFEDFFKEIGYNYDYSGNFNSQWYEGIGVRFN